MGFAGCRSSGVLTSSAVVSSDRALLISIHATEVGGSAATIKIWDNTAASGKEVARITLAANQTIEFDMHGVICTNGIFFEEDAGSVAVSVEFA
tara:strand:+ start:1297 stop:1578 length:282 start_codon:yes stop_codon:yes gene_type:complete